VSPSGLQHFRPVYFRPAASSEHGSQLERLSIVERGAVRGVEQQVWTAAELEMLSPAERHELFDASVVTDLDQADLDRQLRCERGPSGEPSTNDFQTFELLEIDVGHDWA